MSSLRLVYQQLSLSVCQVHQLVHRDVYHFGVWQEIITVGDPLSLETHMDVSLETLKFALETPVFWLECPVFSLETPVFSLETPDFHLRSQIFIVDPQIFYGEPKLFIGDPNENPGASNKTSIGVFNERGSFIVLQWWRFLPNGVKDRYYSFVKIMFDFDMMLIKG